MFNLTIQHNLGVFTIKSHEVILLWLLRQLGHEDQKLPMLNSAEKHTDPN